MATGQPKKMKRGKSEADTIRLNDWSAGDVLEGTEGCQTSRILITGVGEQQFLCRWFNNEGKLKEESGNTTLSCREWKKVGRIAPYRVGVFLAPAADDPTIYSLDEAEQKARTLAKGDHTTAYAVWDDKDTTVLLFLNNEVFTRTH